MGYEYVKDRVIGVQKRREISPVHDLVVKQFLLQIPMNSIYLFFYDLENTKLLKY